MNCGNCGAPARLDRERGLIVCDYCGSEAMPPTTEDGVQVLVASDLRCPACNATLSEGRIESHELLYCESCKGLLVDMDTFLPLVDALRLYRSGPCSVLSRRDEDALKQPRVCPHCQGAMGNHPYGGGGNVFIDTCEKCCVNWLDKGELQRIVAAPDPVHYAPVYSDYGSAGESDRPDE
jgi:Zn-finger nucleic acid-binding protein